TLDEGLNKAIGSTAAAPVRRMINGTSLMSYNIFSSTANRTTGTAAVAWGTANAPALVAPTGVAQQVTAFVGIPAGQTALVGGGYPDPMPMTLTFGFRVPRVHLLRCALVAGAVLAAAAPASANLRFEPVYIYLRPGEPATVLKLTNDGTTPTRY